MQNDEEKGEKMRTWAVWLKWKNKKSLGKNSQAISVNANVTVRFSASSVILNMHKYEVSQ